MFLKFKPFLFFIICLVASVFLSFELFASEVKKYEVLVQGSNFLIMVEGNSRKSGFYVTRFLEAKNPEEAETQVVSTLKADKALTEIILNKPDNSPVLNVIDIKEIKSFEGIELPGSGYAFYPEDKPS